MPGHEFDEGMKREDLVISKAKRSDSSDQIYVFFPDEEKVGIKTMKTYTNRMKSENVFRALLVVQQNLTPFARTCISEISAKFHLEVFLESELLVNIKEHVLAPEHQVLTTEEKKTLLSSSKGIRGSEKAGRYVAYRYVVRLGSKHVLVPEQQALTTQEIKTLAYAKAFVLLIHELPLCLSCFSPVLDP
ncbi:hypothetical protein ACJRO7_016273 [Eucalyptus globulus]|uniref:Uncharacterized protein n=1 Tax=Eucalyptus globulus TaxID=34317 RepID=A0ABD3LC83_EUCGL